MIVTYDTRDEAKRHATNRSVAVFRADKNTTVAFSRNAQQALTIQTSIATSFQDPSENLANGSVVAVVIPLPLHQAIRRINQILTKQ